VGFSVLTWRLLKKTCSKAAAKPGP